MDLRVEVLQARRGGLTLRAKGAWIHSSYDPLAEARRWAEGVECSAGDTVIVLGIGLGYHLAALADRLKRGRIIALEPSKELEDCCSAHWVFRDSAYGVPVVVFDRRQPLHNFLVGQIDQFSLSKVKVVEYPPLQRLFPREFLTWGRQVNDVLFTILSSAVTTLTFGIQWTANFFANLPKAWSSLPVKRLERVFEGRPGIIVSAGPSLKKNIGMLKELEGRAVLLVVGTALRPVLAAGVRPTFVVSIDGSEANYRHFQDLDTSDIPLVYEYTIYPSILRDYRGPLIGSVFLDVFNEWLDHMGWERPGQIREGPSVANFAFDLALHLGLDPIILVGQDLAYTDGYTHASGTTYCQPVSADAPYLLEIDGINGGKVLTSRSLYSMLQYLETQIAMTASGRRVINATEGGARIAGTEVMTLRQARDRYCQEYFGPEERVKQICASYTGPGQEELGAAAERIKQEAGKLREVLKICRSGVRLAQDLELAFRAQIPDPRRIDRILKRLDRVDAELKSWRVELLPVNMAFQPVWFRLNQGTFAREEDDRQEEALRVARKSRLLYQGLVEGIEMVSRAMLQAAEELSGSR